MHIAQTVWQCETVEFLFAGFIKDAEINPAAMPGNHGDIHAITAECNAQWRRCSPGLVNFGAQVITEGAARAVRASIWASERDSFTRSASADWVS